MQKLQSQFRGAIRAACGFDRNHGETVRAFLGTCSGGGSWFLQTADGFYHQENDKGDDQKINHILNEIAVGYLGAANSECQAREINSANDEADQRHDHVIHQ